jgi:hypothetical protein
MKKCYFFLLLLSIIFTSCSSYQYSARQINVQRQSIGNHEQMANIDVDYTKQVTATSEYQLTRQDAIQEAEFLCIQHFKIDVVVDPIVKVEYNPFKLKKRYKATVVGFAGMYKEAPTKLDKSKKYTLEEIEKYKLLTDPTFPQYYYNNGEQGDQYYFGPKTEDSKKESSSFIMQRINRSYLKAPKNSNYQKSTKLRNEGICIVGSGVAMAAIGIGCMLSHNYTANRVGTAFVIIGSVSTLMGIPILTIGSIRTKKIGTMDVTLNADSNGLGVGLTF